jgi:hypothetical protein
MREPFGGVKAGKARADDDHAGATSRRSVGGVGGCGSIVLCRFAHWMPFRRRFGFRATELRMRERWRRWQGIIAD